MRIIPCTGQVLKCVKNFMIRIYIDKCSMDKEVINLSNIEEHTRIKKLT